MTTAIASHTRADGSITAVRLDVEDLLYPDAVDQAVSGTVRLLAEAMARLAED